MKKRWMLAVVTGVILAGGLARWTMAGESIGWKRNLTGWWYQTGENQWYADCVADIEGVLYHFNEEGYMTVGWSKDENEHGYAADWYYSNKDGAVQTGWQYLNGSWYYLDPTIGWMYGKGSYNIDGINYWFTATGEMITGWHAYRSNDNTYDTWVYCDENGAVHNGWLSYKNKWYYLQQGLMLTDCITPDGYYVDDEGVWVP